MSKKYVCENSKTRSHRTHSLCERTCNLQRFIVFSRLSLEQEPETELKSKFTFEDLEREPEASDN